MLSAFSKTALLELIPYALVVLGILGALVYSIRASLLSKYSLGYVGRAALRHWYELVWVLLLTSAAALLLVEVAVSSVSLPPHLRGAVGFLVGAFCGSSASFVERNMWNVKIVSNLVLRPTNDLSLAVLTRLDRTAAALERADNDAWQCQSGYWNLGIEPVSARNRMRLIFEGSKEKMVTRWGRSDIYFMDARWHPGNYFFLLARYYGRRKLRKMLRNPPRFKRISENWDGTARRKVAGRPKDRRDGYEKGNRMRRYDHLG